MARTHLFRKIQSWLRTPSEEESIRARLSGPAFNRRKLVHSGAQLVAWSALPACVTNMNTSTPPLAAPVPREDVEDLVIIGGGLAGLTCAYTLARAGIKVRVYEAAERWGGRVFTHATFNDQNMFCERGAEFVDTGHEDLIALAQELGVPLQPLKDAASPLAQEVYFFGGKWRPEKEVVSAFKPLGKIMQRDMKKLTVGDELQVPTYKAPIGAAVMEFDRLSLEEYLQRCRSQVDDWVLELVRVAYVGEYGLEAGEQSALNLLILIDASTKDGFRVFGESDEAFRISGGSSQLVQALVDKLKEMGVQLFPGHHLLSLRDKAQGLEAVFQIGTRTLELKSAQIILALPLPLLSRIEGWDALDLSPVKKRLVKEMGFGTNSKLMLGFKNRYWRTKHPAFAANEGSIYSEGATQAFWDSSRKQTGEAGILTNFLGGDGGRRIDTGKIAKVLSELDGLMPGIQALHDGHKLLHHWTSDALAGGSYSCPRPGQYTTLVGAAEESELNGRLHFVGEHCSVDYGGYMNGAVASARSLSQMLLAAVQKPAAS